MTSWSWSSSTGYWPQGNKLDCYIARTMEEININWMIGAGRLMAQIVGEASLKKLCSCWGLKWEGTKNERSLEATFAIQLWHHHPRSFHCSHVSYCFFLFKSLVFYLKQKIRKRCLFRCAVLCVPQKAFFNNLISQFHILQYKSFHMFKRNENPYFK